MHNLRRVVVNGESYYCCLGRLCELARAAGATSLLQPPHVTAGNEVVFTYGNLGDDFNSRMLPTHVRKWAGLSASEEDKLARMNDDGATFAEIADYLEQSPV